MFLNSKQNVHTNFSKVLTYLSLPPSHLQILSTRHVSQKKNLTLSLINTEKYMELNEINKIGVGFRVTKLLSKNKNTMLNKPKYQT